MRCPRCGATDDRVVDSRSVQNGTATRRRRECAACGERFTTYEYVEAFSLIIIKRDGRREPYDRSKLQGGLITACKKRPVPIQQIEDIVRWGYPLKRSWRRLPPCPLALASTIRGPWASSTRGS